MKKPIIFFSFLAALILMQTSSVLSQEGFRVKFFDNTRDDGGMAYNFFVGDDAEQFGTSINGFGSGFIFDVLAGRHSVDFISLGTEAIHLSAGAGIAINKYRFSDNLVFQLQGDQVVVIEDTDSDHDYINTFFGYGKSKLVYGSVYFPVYFNISAGPVYLSAGVFFDRYLAGKHKRKFKVDGEKEKILIEPNEFKDFNLNKSKYGINASLVHKNTGFGIGFTYMLTPFFQEGKGPDLNEMRISFTYDFAKYTRR